MKRLILFGTVLLFLTSCDHHEQSPADTTKAGNVSTTISEDSARLSKLIDLSRFKPLRVRFKYVFVDNSGSGQRQSVPGPSDSNLEALLVFSAQTMDSLRSDYFSMDYPSQNLSWQQFNFEWLDKETARELSMSDTSYHGHLDAFFAKRTTGKLWLLGKKVLLQY